MKFDIIIGNPPYNKNNNITNINKINISKSRGKTGSSPIYHKFIEKLIKLKHDYLSMIIPNGWFVYNKDLDSFRELMKKQNITNLVNYSNTSDIFKNIDIINGVCYFLIDNKNNKKEYCECNFDGNINKINLTKNDIIMQNDFNNYIINKVKNKSNNFMNEVVTGRIPFGISQNVEMDSPNEYSKIKLNDDYIEIFSSNKINGFFNKRKVFKNINLINKYNVIITYINDYGYKVISNFNIIKPNQLCSGQYLILNSFDTENEANNFIIYLKTKFVRFLIKTLKSNVLVSKKIFSYVPVLDMNITWTDKMLYEHFELSNEEINYIEEYVKL